MTTEEAYALSLMLAKKIETLVQEFETDTGCFVHSIPVTQRSAKAPATVDVKVQITPPR